MKLRYAVGNGFGIVLGNEGPMPVTWMPTPDGILLAQLYTSEAGFPERLPSIPDDLSWMSVGDFVADGAALVLFDSTEVGDEEPIFPRFAVTLAAGTYHVETATLTTAEMHVWLVRLRTR